MLIKNIYFFTKIDKAILSKINNFIIIRNFIFNLMLIINLYTTIHYNMN